VDYLQGSELDRVRLAALTEAAARCAFCGHQPADLSSLRIRSRWRFDDRTLTQRLTAVVALCSHCDDARRLLEASDPRDESARLAVAHLAQVNRWSAEAAIAYALAVQDINLSRAQHEWSLDVHWLRTIDIVIPGLDARVDLDQTYLPAHGFNRAAGTVSAVRVEPPAALCASAPVSTRPRESEAGAYALTERVPVEIQLHGAATPAAPALPPPLAPAFAALDQDARELWTRFTAELGPARRFPDNLAFLDGELALWACWRYLEPRTCMEPAFLIHLLVRAVQRAATALVFPWRTRTPEYRSNLPADAQRILPGLPIWRDAFFLYETARFRSSSANRPAVRLVTALWRLTPRARQVLRELRRLDAERLRLCGDSSELEIQTRFPLYLPDSLHEAAEHRSSPPASRTRALDSLKIAASPQRPMPATRGRRP